MWVDMRNVLSSGDAEDHIEIMLRAPDKNGQSHGPMVQIEISAAMAYGQDYWQIGGKNSGLKGNHGSLEWKWVDWSELPERPVERTPTPGRTYNREQLAWQTGAWKNENRNEAGLTEQFYANFAASVREGKPLDITPESVRQQIAVIERAKELGGFAD